MGIYKNNQLNKIYEKYRDITRVKIYGAGVMGKALKLCLEAEPFCKKIECFIVNDTLNNPDNIDGIQVVGLDSADVYKHETVIVALNEKNMPGAVNDLESKGFTELVILNAAGDEWSYIKSLFFINNVNECYIPYRLLSELSLKKKYTRSNDISIYIAESIYDKPTKIEMPIRPFEKEIQVGAALTEDRFTQLTDDVGDNISYKNKQYCELTALYWIWKNASNKYIGLSHYRRRFDITSDLIDCFEEAQVDIAVTIPVINTLGIEKQYYLSHSMIDWNILRDEVHHQSPEYDESFAFVEKQIYFHPYNMMIMRKTVMDSFCSWMFPILFECEDKIGTKEDRYQNRYLGFLSERLLNVFLYHNRNKYGIYIVDKKYLG